MARPARFRPPKATRPSLLRARLLARLLLRWERRLVTVIGGPGFGKTTLLGQAVAENELSPKGIDVWLSCESDDEQASYMASGLLDGLGSSATPSDAAAAARAVADAVWSRAPRHVAIILDDVHEIRAGSSGTDLLAQLVGELPENGHLVVGSRAAPPFPLARLLAEGAVEQIGEEDLRFTTDEAEGFADLRGVEATDLAATASWPALAELAATAGRRVVADYLWDEVLGEVSADRRRLLAIATTLGSVDGELLSAVTNHRVDVDELFDGVPLVGVTEDGWRLVHALWEPVLARELTPVERRDVRRRAGQVLLQRGRTHDAFQLFADAEAWDDIRRVILDSCQPISMAARSEELSRWLRRLPPAMRGEPEALLLEAVIRVAEKPAGAADALRSATAAFRDRGGQEGELLAVTHLALLAFYSDDPEGLAEIGTALWDLEAAGYAAARPLAELARAAVAYLDGDHARAWAELDAIGDESLGAFAPLADLLRSESLSYLGQPDRAVEFARRAVGRATRIFRQTADVVYSTAQWYAGHVDEALDGIADVVARAQDTGITQAVARSAVFASGWSSYLGDIERARAFLQIAEGATAAAAGRTPAGRLDWARAALDVVLGSDDDAAGIVIANHPAPQPHTRFGPFFYVLAPGVRSIFDTGTIGPSLDVARGLARALVALRERNSLDEVRRVHLPDPGTVRAHLPLPWAATLAVAAIATGRDEGRAILDALGPPARPTVRALTSSPVREVASTAKRLLHEIPAVPSATLEVRALGPLSVVRDGEELRAAELRRERVRGLLLFLVAHPQTTREAAAAALWPDLDPQASSNNLRVTLSYLLRVLEPDRAEGDASFFIRTTPAGGLHLVADGRLVVDAWAFELLCRQAADHERQGAASLVLETLLEALAMYRGAYLADLPYADWAVPHTERLRRRFVDAVRRVGDLMIAAGRADEAVDLAERAIGAEPHDETGFTLLVAAHTSEGRTDAADAAEDRRRVILQDLGIA